MASLYYKRLPINKALLDVEIATLANSTASPYIIINYFLFIVLFLRKNGFGSALLGWCEETAR
jgi:hypothetical protein